MCVLHNRIGPVRMNNEIMIIGPSGVSKKTIVPLNFIYPRLEQVSELIRIDLRRKYEVEEGKDAEDLDWIQDISLNFANGGSISAWKSHVCRKVPGHRDIVLNPTGVMIEQEFGRLFKSRRKERMDDLLETICDFEDNACVNSITHGRGIERVSSSYDSMITRCSDNFFQLVDEDFHDQGAGNRFCPVLVGPEDIIEPGEFGDAEVDNFFQRSQNTSAESPFVTQLKHAHDHLPITFFDDELEERKMMRSLVIEHDAGLKWGEYWKDKEKQAIGLWKGDCENNQHTFLSRVPPKGPEVRRSVLHRQEHLQTASQR